MDKLAFFYIVGLCCIGFVSGQAGVCPKGEDYRPCTCHHYSYGDEVYCNNVPLQEVANVFKRTTPSDLYRFDLYLPSVEGDVIPTNLLNNHRVTFRIELHCPTHGGHLLKLNPDAFESSRNSSQLLWIYHCNTDGMDFDFLTGFSALRYLYLYYSNNVHLAQWANLPSLPSLTRLHVINSTGLNEWVELPNLSRGLTEVIFDNDNINNDGMERLLNWLAGNSANSLVYLSTPQNDLTRIPSQLSRFTKLEQLFLGNQRRGISDIPSGSLNFPSPVLQLGINSCRVSTIQPGAFQGDFSRADVRLYYNSLTRFESAVFKTILEQMVTSTGSVRVEYNPFDCESDPCHLAWLIRDHRELLVPLGRGGYVTCSNGTRFDQLDPKGLSGCPA